MMAARRLYLSAARTDKGGTHGLNPELWTCHRLSLSQPATSKKGPTPGAPGSTEGALELQLLDLGNHLEEQRVMTAELARHLDGLARFRNILVHDYLRLEHEEVHGIPNERLDAQEELGAVFLEIVG